MGFKFWLCFFPDAWSWAAYPLAFSLSFPICEMGTKITPGMERGFSNTQNPSGMGCSHHVSQGVAIQSTPSSMHGKWGQRGSIFLL